MLTRSSSTVSTPFIPQDYNVSQSQGSTQITALISFIDDTIIDLWGAGPNRPPIDTHHPAVRTHPVTKLKALNVNPGFVTGFAELKKLESGKQLSPISLSRH